MARHGLVNIPGGFGGEAFIHHEGDFIPVWEFGTGQMNDGQKETTVSRIVPGIARHGCGEKGLLD